MVLQSLQVLFRKFLYLLVVFFAKFFASNYLLDQGLQVSEELLINSHAGYLLPDHDQLLTVSTLSRGQLHELLVKLVQLIVPLPQMAIQCLHIVTDMAQHLALIEVVSLGWHREGSSRMLNEGYRHKRLARSHRLKAVEQCLEAFPHSSI